MGEEIAGGGPEDPFADAAAIATLGAGLLISELTPNPSQPKQNCDKCKPLYDAIDNAVNVLQRRNGQLIDNPLIYRKVENSQLKDISWRSRIGSAG